MILDLQHLAHLDRCSTAGITTAHLHVLHDEPCLLAVHIFAEEGDYVLVAACLQDGHFPLKRLLQRSRVSAWKQSIQRDRGSLTTPARTRSTRGSSLAMSSDHTPKGPFADREPITSQHTCTSHTHLVFAADRGRADFDSDYLHVALDGFIYCAGSARSIQRACLSNTVPWQPHSCIVSPGIICHWDPIRNLPHQEPDPDPDICAAPSGRLVL